MFAVVSIFFSGVIAKFADCTGNKVLGFEMQKCPMVAVDCRVDYISWFGNINWADYLKRSLFEEHMTVNSTYNHILFFENHRVTWRRHEHLALVDHLFSFSIVFSFGLHIFLQDLGWKFQDFIVWYTFLTVSPLRTTYFF